MQLKSVLFMVILIEGFVVLATELLAMRLLIPFVGAGTNSMAIIIAAVLMPLAIGYYYGGQFKTSLGSASFACKRIRQRLVNNLSKSLIFLSLGLSYVILVVFFQYLTVIGVQHYLWQTSLYALLFLVAPIYWLGQTVPLVSHYFSHESISKITGKMLCFSTVGSFLGAILTPLVLMGFLGVHHTVIINVMLLFCILKLIAPKGRSWPLLGGYFALILAVLLNNGMLIKQLGIVSNNAFSTIHVWHQPHSRLMSINHSLSSKIAQNKKNMLAYWQWIDKQLIQPIQVGPVKHILVIGSGGFTIGLQDQHNQYTFVDVDPALKPVAEKYFLQHPLSHNKHFVVAPARRFLHQTHQHYDAIILDAFSHLNQVPEQLITRQFFQTIKQHLKPHGVMLMNSIMSPNFNDAYSVKLDHTLHQVFPVLSRQVIQSYNLWQAQQPANVLYSFVNHSAFAHGSYSDLKNSYYRDRHA